MQSLNLTFLNIEKRKTRNENFDDRKKYQFISII